tara:strand:+ start:902 stop:1411 length:510 start_codon:yes stop_codon:yes gene_type:complete
MSWQDILKEMDAEEELERDALRRDIEAERYSESYEKPSFKKVEEKLRELRDITIPQDRRMLEFVTRQGFKHPTLTIGKLNSLLRKIYQAERELEKVKKEAKKYADENPNYGPDDVLLNEVFEDSDSEYATDRGFQMLMSNQIDGENLGFGINIASSVREYQQLFSRRKL